MPVKIRLMLIGAKKRPFYRVVAVDERKKRTGKYIELLGTYNPISEPKEIILTQDKIDAWIKKGAVLSDGYLRMTKQAPQRPPRKPKKDRKSSAANPMPSEKQPENVTPENQPTSAEKPEVSSEAVTTEETVAEVETKEPETINETPTEGNEETPTETAEEAKEEVSTPEVEEKNTDNG